MNDLLLKKYKYNYAMKTYSVIYQEIKDPNINEQSALIKKLKKINVIVDSFSGNILVTGSEDNIKNILLEYPNWRLTSSKELGLNPPHKIKGA